MEVLFPSLARARRSSSFSLPPAGSARHTAVLEDDLGGVRGPDAHLLEVLALGDTRRTFRDDEVGLPPAAGVGVDREDGTWVLAMPPLVVQVLVRSAPTRLGLVVHGA